MTSTLDINNIKEALTCSICQEIATLPVHATCCEKAKSMAPGCLSCVRTYYELNKRNRDRQLTKKSWGGCGCDVNTQNKYSNSFYQHTVQLDMIRNLLGPSKCYHEECGIECETSAELRRHLTGTAKDSDKFKNCPEATTKCPHCNYYDKRKIVYGEHYQNFMPEYIVNFVNNMFY